MAPPLIAIVAHGVAVTAGGPEFGPPYDGRLLTYDRALAASRLPNGRNGRTVAATFAAPVHRRSSASPRSYGDCLNFNNWRCRIWTPALSAAGVDLRGPYHLRHTFATEALAAGVSIFELSRLMGASVATIDKTYGHLAQDSEPTLRRLLSARSGRSGVLVASPDDRGS